MPDDAVMNAVIQALEIYVDRCLRGETPDKIAERTLADGRIVRVTPIGLLRAQVSISELPPLEKSLIRGTWEYKTQVQALIAAFGWDGEGEPANWWRAAAPDLSLVYNEQYKDR